MSTFGSLLSLGSAAAQFAGVEGAILGANAGAMISLTALAHALSTLHLTQEAVL